MKKGILSLLLVFALAMALPMVAFAQAAPEAQNPHAISSETLVVLDGSAAISEGAAPTSQEAQPESQEAQPSSAEVLPAQEQQPKSGGDSNTPLFVIAGISMIGFVAVVIICKKKGRNR